jgi:hypothetical protein
VTSCKGLCRKMDGMHSVKTDDFMCLHTAAAPLSAGAAIQDCVANAGLSFLCKFKRLN